MPSLLKSDLSDKEQAFCAWYFTTGNGVQSILKAGYDCDYNTAGVMAVEYLEKPKIKAQIQALSDSHYTGEKAVTDIQRRKSRLQEIVDHDIETPVSAGHRVAAAKELNLMERVYTDNHTTAPMVAIQVVLPSAQSTQSLPEPAKVVQLEAKSSSITAIVRGNEAISQAKRLLKGHRWTAEEKEQLMREVFGEDVPALPPGETPPTSDSQGAGG